MDLGLLIVVAFLVCWAAVVHERAVRVASLRLLFTGFCMSLLGMGLLVYGLGWFNPPT